MLTIRKENNYALHVVHKYDTCKYETRSHFLLKYTEYRFGQYLIQNYILRSNTHISIKGMPSMPSKNRTNKNSN